jgi:hypothetical protein
VSWLNEAVEKTRQTADLGSEYINRAKLDEDFDNVRRNAEFERIVWGSSSTTNNEQRSERA